MSVKFTDEQLDYINSSIKTHIFLEACPGSGKTEVVAAKVAKEINQWRNKIQGMAILSFANSATDELAHRVSKYLKVSQNIFPHFLGTFDSFIYKNIVSPLATELTNYIGSNRDSSIRIVEPSANLGYRTKYSYIKRGKVYAHKYSFSLTATGNIRQVIFDTGDSILDRTLKGITLERWQLNDFIDTKNKMLNGGFATYRDIECLALITLTSIEYKEFINLLVKRYPLIIIDECQDLSKEQLAILKILADNGAKLHFIGDLHQSIYGFREVDPTEVKQFVLDNNFSSLRLTRNFRSCQNIVNVCAQLTGRTGIIGNISWLKPRCLIVQYKNCPTELISTFDKLCKNYENNAILSRGHNIIQKFYTSTSQLNNMQKLALSIKLFDSNNMDTINNSLEYFSDFIHHYLNESTKSNSFHCPYSINSSLLWRKFLYNSLNFFIKNKMQDLEIDWSSWVKKIKPLVHILSKQDFCPDIISNILTSLNTANLSSPKGLSTQKVSTSLGITKRLNSLFRKSTIHGAKGETHDVTILISSAKSGNEAHWLDWLKDPQSEAARFAYVASSRPREYLIWAVKTLKTDEIKKLESIGFTIV